MGEDTAVLIPFACLGIELEGNGRFWGKLGFGKLAGFFTITFRRPLGVDSFRGVDAEKANGFFGAILESDDDGVAVDDADNCGGQRLVAWQRGVQPLVTWRGGEGIVEEGISRVDEDDDFDGEAVAVDGVEIDGGDLAG